jgi:hypothetical protein
MTAPAEEPPKQPNHLQQQELPQAQPEQKNIDWATLLDGIFIGLLVFIFGPAVIRAVYLKEWVRESAWEAHERQKVINNSVFLYLLFYIPIFFLRTQIAWLWTSLFHIIHLSWLVWFGSVALWPPTFSSMLSTMPYRWLLSLPLTYALARILQILDQYVGKPPVSQPVRVLLPDEMMQLAAPPKAKKAKATAPTASKSATSTKPRTTRTSTKKRTTVVDAAPITPKADSLWGAAWNAVPEADPAKQAIRHEVSQEEAERDRWLREQQKKQPGQQAQTATPPGTMQKTTPPSTAPSHDDEEGYDWGSGDGALPL